MKTSRQPDVAVVGLGAIGAAVLYQLARAGIDAVGIDQYALPHVWGSSHGETRITRCAVGEGRDYTPLALASHRIWREIEAETGASLLEACGCLVIASSGSDAIHHGKTDFVGRSAESARDFGIPHELISGEEAMHRFPQIERAEGARAYFEPGGGFVYPERCIAVQLDQARRLGAQVMTTQVRSVTQKQDVVVIETSDQTITARRAVVAAGPWTGALMGAPFDQLLSVSRQVLHWFPVDGATYAPGRFPTLIWIHGETTEDYFYAFPSLPGSGLLKAATERYGGTTTPESVDRRVGPGEAAMLYREHLATRLGDIGTPAARSATCLYTVTPDSDFIIDRHPGMDRVTVISACSGHGFKHSAGIGEMVALSLAEDTDKPALAAFALKRFPKHTTG